MLLRFYLSNTGAGRIESDTVGGAEKTTFRLVMVPIKAYRSATFTDGSSHRGRRTSGL